ncbi:twin-arginine translocation pathway signal protein [Pacificimonas flava]|uniref:Twin-arginine translocation pathway signal protein n=2 Tax=Pacificimonas TaxID=1960290 RepID=A0A219B647_9SPHN|nr:MULTISPECIES: M20/M25/M40 family metallo-hydrolase [Pacificimonas]MBZ6379548.1 M20/M25/M40 family metallo-hydrolase [Pacificimonas aurantium]OWV33268.1 twin-arginine translocation pathway signal protein [Pacificimonas flava]
MLSFLRHGAACTLVLAASLPAVPALAQSAEEEAALRSAAESGRDASIKRIQDWIALPSIAAEDLNMQEGVEYMATLAREAGFDEVEIVPTSGHPGVFATMDNGADRTLAVYFMYDVKQFDPAEWSSPPLEGAIVEKEGFGRAIMGRGAVNQKGPEATFLAALHAFKEAGITPPVNLVLIAEGEEEIGSPNFGDMTAVPHIQTALKEAEGIFIPASWQDRSGAVDVNLGSKGVVELELISDGANWGPGPKTDIHSSLKAAVESPAWRLVHALETLVEDGGNTPAIEGWYENVRPLTEHEKDLIREGAALVDPEEQKETLGITRWIDDLPYDEAMIRLAQEPTVNIEGLVSGYTGPGGKTILPGRAVAKIDLRLVPNQTREEAERKMRAHLDANGFEDIEIEVSGGYDPTETAEDSLMIRAEMATYERLGIPYALNPRLAGSWPGAMFTDPPLSLPAGHFGIGHGSGAHAPDEYYVVESTNPNVAGLVDATMGYAHLLYAVAEAE